uniref:Uncharacterized protein n=1 Tax=viral metagenome TaxID=1070528 RepID=A0A6M3KU91_9ZZZZ
MKDLTGYLFLLLAVVLAHMLINKQKATNVDSKSINPPGPETAANPFDQWYNANVAPTHGAYSTVS